MNFNLSSIDLPFVDKLFSDASPTLLSSSTLFTSYFLLDFGGFLAASAAAIVVKSFSFAGLSVLVEVGGFAFGVLFVGLVVFDGFGAFYSKSTFVFFICFLGELIASVVTFMQNSLTLTLSFSHYC